MWAMPAAKPLCDSVSLRATAGGGGMQGVVGRGMPVSDEGAQLLRVGVALAQRLEAQAHVLRFFAELGL